MFCMWKSLKSSPFLMYYLKINKSAYMAKKLTINLLKKKFIIKAVYVGWLYPNKLTCLDPLTHIC